VVNAVSEAAHAPLCHAAGPAAAEDERVARAWAVLQGVCDPEVPVISLVELGIVRAVLAAPATDDEALPALTVVLTPTYSGCPATEVIEASVREALNEAALGPLRIETRRHPAWTTDWISQAGLDKLRAYGIAPPARLCSGAAALPAQPQPIHLLPRRPLAPVACPRCGSMHTERLAAFGATACKALHRCLDCREPFEHFKPI
jgi:ring-1,2-phenylacetyl-CoA epoxidase subunit PaaD